MLKTLLLGALVTGEMLASETAYAGCGNRGWVAAPPDAVANAPTVTRRTLSVEPGYAPAFRVPTTRRYTTANRPNSMFDAGRKIRGDY